MFKKEIRGIKWKQGQQRETEFIRVKGLMSDKIYHPLTLRFLKAVGDSNENGKVTLVNQNSSEVCIDYYWNEYHLYTKICLQAPYVV